MEKVIKFGTDGWRAVIAEEFTFDNVRACAQGTVDYLKKSGIADKGLVIGYDTRFASEDFAAACAEVVAANGINVYLCSKTAPTPVISYSVVAKKAAGAIIITASHNPGQWNGFKYKDSSGASASGEIVSEIENCINAPSVSESVIRISLASACASGKVIVYDPLPEYTEQVNRLIDVKLIRQNKVTVCVDSMFGAGIGYFSYFLKDGKVKIVEINDERNPIFPGINPEPIAKNLQKLCKLIKDQKGHVGLATDGDSDRIGIVSEQGVFLTQHQVFALLALYFLEVRGEKGAIIKSLCSTDMIDILGKQYNVPVYTTKVGFKYVAPLMLEHDAFMGGEESGGYGFRGHVPERDGILAGLFFLDFMRKTGKTPSQLLKNLYEKVGPHYYDRYDSHVTSEQHKIIMSKIAESKIDQVAGIKVNDVDRRDGYKYILDDNSWLLMRFSGTEPLIRIYAESQSMEKVKTLLDYGKEEIAGIHGESERC